MKKRALLTFILSVAVSNALIFPAFAGGVDIKSAHLQVLWSVPITIDPGPPAEVGKPHVEPRSKGLALAKASPLPDGHLLFLGDLFEPASYSRVLLRNAEMHGPEETTKLQLKGAWPKPSKSATFWEKIFGLFPYKPTHNPVVDSLVVDEHGAIWVADQLTTTGELPQIHTAMPILPSLMALPHLCGNEPTRQETFRLSWAWPLHLPAT